MGKAQDSCTFKISCVMCGGVAVLGFDSSASGMLDRCSTTELHPGPQQWTYVNTNHRQCPNQKGFWYYSTEADDTQFRLMLIKLSKVFLLFLFPFLLPGPVQGFKVVTWYGEWGSTFPSPDSTGASFGFFVVVYLLLGSAVNLVFHLVL